jgi:hypothetical protein
MAGAKQVLMASMVVPLVLVELGVVLGAFFDRIQSWKVEEQRDLKAHLMSATGHLAANSSKQPRKPPDSSSRWP